MTIPSVAAPLAFVLPGLIFVLACEGEPGGFGEGAPSEASRSELVATAITDADTVTCGMQQDMHRNRSQDTLTFNVRVLSMCLDSMAMGVTTVQVLDSTGRVLALDTARAGVRYRGTLEVPPGGTLRIDCNPGAPNLANCFWDYTYNLP